MSSDNNRPSDNNSLSGTSGADKSFLGSFLAAQLTPDRCKLWRRIFFTALLVVALLNLVITNHHPHFGPDRYPFFWPIFGLVCGLVLIFIVKKIIQPVIKRPEDHYGDL